MQVFYTKELGKINAASQRVTARQIAALDTLLAAQRPEELQWRTRGPDVRTLTSSIGQLTMNPKGPAPAQPVSMTEKGKGRALDVEDAPGDMDIDDAESAPAAKKPKRKNTTANAEEPLKKKKKGSAAAPAAPRNKRQIRLELKAINGMHWEPPCDRCARNGHPCKVKFQRSDRSKLVCYECASKKATCNLASTAKKCMDSLGELGPDDLDSSSGR